MFTTIITFNVCQTNVVIVDTVKFTNNYHAGYVTLVEDNNKQSLKFYQLSSNYRRNWFTCNKEY